MDTNQKMDALADILNTIRLSASTYFCTDFSSPWGIHIEKGSEGLFHVVVNGNCWLQIENAANPIALNRGDIVAFPTGGAHSISDTPDSVKLPGATVTKSIADGNNPFQSEPHSSNRPYNTLMCGAFHYDTSIKHPFLKDLPCFIHIKANETPKLDWLRTLLTVLSNESREPTPGSTVMIDRLTEVLFIQLMRTHMESSPQHLNYMTALSDRQIGTALNHIHADKDATWNVERLGEAVALSRTAFTEKFSRLVGMPPKTYLLNWRMQKAKTQLETTDVPMIAIAENTGYSSEAAFSKAYKQFFNNSPGQTRRLRSSRTKKHHPNR